MLLLTQPVPPPPRHAGEPAQAAARAAPRLPHLRRRLAHVPGARRAGDAHARRPRTCPPRRDRRAARMPRRPPRRRRQLHVGRRLAAHAVRLCTQILDKPPHIASAHSLLATASSPLSTPHCLACLPATLAAAHPRRRLLAPAGTLGCAPPPPPCGTSPATSSTLRCTRTRPHSSPPPPPSPTPPPPRHPPPPPRRPPPRRTARRPPRRPPRRPLHPPRRHRPPRVRRRQSRAPSDRLRRWL